MLGGMVLSGKGPKIIELKLNKVRWECLEKLRRQRACVRFGEKTCPRMARTALVIRGCGEGLGKEDRVRTRSTTPGTIES